MEPEANITFKVDNTKFDDCNALVLPDKRSSAENKTSKSNASKSKAKIVLLSKKKRKKLEKVLERKSKKFNRAQLISDLQQFQLKNKEYNMMPSTSVVQTAGRKRINDILQLYNSMNNNNETPDSSDAGDFRKLKIPRIRMKYNEKNFNRDKIPSAKDLSIIGQDDDGVESSDCSTSEGDISDDEPEVNETKAILTAVEEPTPEPIVEETVQTSAQKRESKAEPAEKKECPKSVFVTVNRPEKVQNARLKLPILSEEHRIMEEIMYHPVVIICGETGSGKTTQVPQFLYEAGYHLNGKMVGVTEPRRVAAISMSKRVAHELNLTSKEVSYQIRFEGNVTEKTAIKFMTDGILLKEIQNDFMLRKYSAIIIDEAHERSLMSDILIAFLSRVVLSRQKQGDPLKLIIMSATLRVGDFTENEKLFKEKPPVIKIDSRQYPVSVHFSKRTNDNYLREAYKKVCKIHSSLPSGGILVFLTGRQEVNSLCKMLRERFPFKNDSFADSEDFGASGDIDKEAHPVIEPKPLKKVSTVNLDLYSVTPMESERVIDDFDYSDDESDKEDSRDDEEEEEDEDNEVTTNEPLYCLPLYSMLPNSKQALVFKDAPPGCRLCVIATNVAETSLTIPNMKYVIDTGKIKNKVYDNVTGISTFLIEWTSKASADQRAGRAGRTSAGHCYRLYSSAVYNDEFRKYAEPEILVKPIDDLMLQLKSIGIDNVANFPFPSPPKIESLLSAEKRLIMLEALKEESFIGKRNRKIVRSSITPIGRVMATFPVNPRYSKMLCLSSQSDLLPFTVALISALTVQEIFLQNEDASSAKQNRKSVFFNNPNCIILGDLMAILSAMGAANFEGLSAKFCEHYSLRYNAMVEINKLRMQLSQQIKEITGNGNLSLDLAPPSDAQIKLLRQLFLCGFIDHVAKRIPVAYTNEEDGSGNVTKKAKAVRNCYQSTEVESPVYISPHSVLFNESPQYVVYHDIFESSKMYMRHVVVIEPEWLPIYASKYCNFSNPLSEPTPRYDSREDKVKCHRSSTFGPHCWQLPAIETEYPECSDKYRYFACFLFSGDILKFFARNAKYLNAQPIIFTKPWALVQPKVEKVITALAGNGITSKKALLSMWKNRPNFLLGEYIEWLSESQKDKIRSSWPPSN